MKIRFNRLNTLIPAKRNSGLRFSCSLAVLFCSFVSVSNAGSAFWPPDIETDTEKTVALHNVSKQSRNELLVIDGDIENSSTLLDVFAARKGISVDVLPISQHEDGVQQVSQFLQNENRLYSAVHIISHGRAGEFDLGNASISHASLTTHNEALKQWSDALTPDADLLIYACNLVGDEAGQELIGSIAKFTGADVSASNDLTGAQALGGDWTLEVATGDIQTKVLNDPLFPGTLNLKPTVDLDADNSGFNPGTFPDAAIEADSPTKYSGILGDGASVASNVTIQSTVNIGVNPEIAVNLVSGSNTAVEITMADDAVSPEASEGLRIVTSFSPRRNTNMPKLIFRQSPNQDMKAGTVNVFFEGNAILRDPDNQIANELDGAVINSTDSLDFASSVAGAAATWSVEVSNPQEKIEFLFDGANDGTAFGNPAFEVEFQLNPIGYSKTFVENSAPIAVADDVAVTHVDGGDLAQLRIGVAGASDGSEEEITIFGQTWAMTDTRTETINVLGTDLSVSPSGGIFYVTKPGGRVSVAEAKSVIESVEYEHTSEHPAAGIRTFSFVAIDAPSNNWRDYSFAAHTDINVISVNDVPEANGDGDVLVVAGVADLIDPIANDIDLDLDQIAIVGVPTASQGVVVVQADNSLLYTPDASFSGTDTITYTIEDPLGASSTSSLVLSDNAVNKPPHAGVDQTVSGVEGSPGGTVIATLGASDPDADDSLIYRITQDTSGGYFALDGDNLIVNPARSLPNIDLIGDRTWQVSVRVTDSHADTDSVNITVEFVDIFEESFGTNNDDVITDLGYAGDTLIGLNGNDVLTGEAGDNQIYGDSLVTIVVDNLEFLEGVSEGEVLANLSATGTQGATTFAIVQDDSGMLEIDGTTLKVAAGGTIPDVDSVNTFFPFVLSVTDDIATHTGSFIGTIFDTPDPNTGTDSSETIVDYGNAGDTVEGLGGNDYLVGDAGDGIVDGGPGNDHIRGGLGADTLLGDAGNDTIYFDPDDVLMDGGAGRDYLRTEAGSPAVNWDTTDYGNFEEYYGSAFSDTIDASAEVAGGGDYLYGYDGNDVITGSYSNDRVWGFDDDDTLDGGPGNDDVRGGSGDDVVAGGAGNDTLRGEEGADVLLGGPGNDNIVDFHLQQDVSLDGGDGVDSVVLDGGSVVTTFDLNEFKVETVNAAKIENGSTYDGSSVTGSRVIVTGTQGDDTILGSPLNDSLNGTDGNDVIVGGAHNDDVIGGRGADSLQGGDGNDRLFIDIYDVLIDGGASSIENINHNSHNASRAAGDDTFDASTQTSNVAIYAGWGNDNLIGSDQNDYLYGQSGDDIISGGLGNDNIKGDDGADVMTGGEGIDTVFCNSAG